MFFPVTEQNLEGETLYGDDLSSEQIRQWYAEEENGYYNLATSYYAVDDEQGNYAYEYGAFNKFHALDFLDKRHFETCLALGCARGDDVAPLAKSVGQFIAVEPAEKWWSDSIGGKPARYVKPEVTGLLDIPDASIDLATSFGVLHHIPNVSMVMSEIARALRPGGLLTLREPISWMGDFRKHRPGLTSNERGLPIDWLHATAIRFKLSPVRIHFCQFNPLLIVAKKCGVVQPLGSSAITRIDYLISSLLSKNLYYRRDTFRKKLAPSSVFAIFRKTE